MTLRYALLMSGMLIGLAACKGDSSGNTRGPIVLGDSSTIVTETNEALLQDQVPDLKPVIASERAEEIPTQQATPDTASKTPAAQQSAASTPPPAGNGLSVQFKEVTVFLPGIAVREKAKDYSTARGASFTLNGGNLQGTNMRVSGSTVTKVSQRTQTMLMLKDGSDRLVLESLPKQTSGWETLTGSGGTYRISNLSSTDLESNMPSPAALRNAVQQAARKARLNRQDTQDWLDAVRNLRSPNQAPATVVLRSVMWRVEGKGFSKEVRVDVPLP